MRRISSREFRFRYVDIYDAGRTTGLCTAAQAAYEVGNNHIVSGLLIGGLGMFALIGSCIVSRRTHDNNPPLQVGECRDNIGPLDYARGVGLGLVASGAVHGVVGITRASSDYLGTASALTAVGVAAVGIGSHLRPDSEI